MLRSPIDVVHSLHWTLHNSGDEPIADFEMALHAEERRKALPLQPSFLMPEALYYREIVGFSEQVRRYFDRFGRDAVKVIIYDDFRRDTRRSYQETLEFLGLQDDQRTTFHR